MAFRCMKLIRTIRSVKTSSFRSASFNVSSVPLKQHLEEPKLHKLKEYRTEDNLIYLEDPDTFGTLSRTTIKQSVEVEDEGDKREEEFTQNKPLKSQQLTTKQYADLIMQYLKHKRLKEAIDVLEVKMLKEDRVKPENYIFNILIGACADVGYTKKAFKLYNDMKRRALKPTGDTYTCLFQACYNSPWLLDGLKHAKHLREFMIEKGIEPNLTNYNAMIKAFGRCGDLPMAFKIVDEMLSKKISIRTHTFNHLLHACISDKENGLRHALIVWRKMLKMREKPNIYTFNLMLKCVKDCNVGSKEDMEELLSDIGEQIAIDSKTKIKSVTAGSSGLLLDTGNIESVENDKLLSEYREYDVNEVTKPELRTDTFNTDESKNVAVIENNETVTLQFINKNLTSRAANDRRLVPNLLSRDLNLDNVMSLQEVKTVQEKFAIVGGQEDFLKEMQVYSIKPDIKIFTQMLPLLNNTTEAETKLLDTMASKNIKTDIEFYNMLIKKRCMRLDYEAAVQVKEIITKENKLRRKKHPFKKTQLKHNIMTYGVLAMACKTKEDAEKLINDMKEAQLRLNAEILGTLLRQGTTNSNFGYVLFIMNLLAAENIKVNPVFLKHLEDFNEKCLQLIKPSLNNKPQCTEIFRKSYGIFSMRYKQWLKEINCEEALKTEHPWAQFKESYPETVQRQKFEIVMPRKFYKRNRKYVPYAPRIN